MNRLDAFKDDSELKEFYSKFIEVYNKLGIKFLDDLQRLPSLPDLFIDRWKRAELLGFGKGTNIYDNSLVIGKVTIGEEVWIGPNTILDGSGGLTIGNYCTISAGVQIYSHDNVKQTLSSKKLSIERSSVTIGNNVYIAPQSVITKGVTIGNNVVIGTFALINKDIPDNSIVIGQPGKIVGEISKLEEQIEFNYFNRDESGSSK